MQHVSVRQHIIYTSLLVIDRNKVSSTIVVLGYELPLTLMQYSKLLHGA